MTFDLGAGTHCDVFTKVADAEAGGWDELDGLSPWMKTAWLQVFAPTTDGGAGGPSTRYLQFRHGGSVIGQALLQRLPLAGMQFGPHLRPAYVGAVLGEQAWQLGQVLFSGPHGVHFLPGFDALEMLGRAREVLSRRGEKCWGTAVGPAQPQTSGTWLVKDLIPGQAAEASRAWWPISALPEMGIDLPTAWRSLEDYQAALPSKYRTRLRRARTKFYGLRTRLLTDSELGGNETNVWRPPDQQQEHRDRNSTGEVGEHAGFGESRTEAAEKARLGNLTMPLDRLYEQLVLRADYVPFRVPPGYVSRLKSLAPERVTLRGYFEGDTLVGFSTLLTDVSGAALAHLAACNPVYNPTHQLYLNMLIDLLATAIDKRSSVLNFGRTATTIKSSLGAVPRAYASFLAHDGCVRHQLLGPVARRTLASREEDLTIQRPFG